MAFHRYHKVDTRIARIFNTYGPRMQINDGRVVPNFMKQALLGEPLTVYGDGSQTRSFCYVSDEIDGFLRLSQSSEHLPVNIGNPNEFTILECALLVKEITQSSSKMVYEPLPQDDPRQRRPEFPKPAAYSAGNQRPTSRPGYVSPRNTSNSRSLKRSTLAPLRSHS